MSTHLRTLAIASLLVCAPGATDAAAQWALGPEAEPQLIKLSEETAGPCKVRPAGIRIEGARVELSIAEPATQKPGIIAITHASTSPSDAIQTRLGGVSFPADWDAPRVAACIEAMDASSARLTWRAITQPGRPLIEQADVRAVTADDGVRKAIFDARIEARIARDRAPRQTGLPRFEGPPRGEALRLLPTRPLDSALWAAAARDAHDAHFPRRAIALADAGSRIQNAGEEAVGVWAALRGVPPTAPLWPVFFLSFGLCIWLGGYLTLSGGREGNMARYVGSLALTAAFSAYLAVQGNPDRRPVPPPELPDTLIAPLAGTACEAAPPLWTADGLAIYALCEGTQARFRIEPTESAEDSVVLPHAVSVESSLSGPAMSAAVAQLTTSVRDAEATGFTAGAWQADAIPELQQLPPTASMDGVETTTTRALVVLGALIALWLQFSLGASVWQAMRRDQAIMRGVLGLAVLTVIVHAVVDSRMVMVYTGYDLTARLAWTKELARYGAGGAWLYEAAFWWFGLDHASMQSANRIFGVLSFIPVAALSVVWAGRHGLFALALYTVLPLVWRDHTSEAMMAGTLWLTLSGLAAMTTVVAGQGRPILLAAASALFAAAMVCRPEAMVTLSLPLVVATLIAGVQAQAPLRRNIFVSMGFCILGLGMSLWPHALWLQEVANEQVASSGIISFRLAIEQQLPETLLRNNLFVDGRLVSPLVLLWALVGLVLGKGQRMLNIVLGLTAFGWLAATSVDLPLVSIPRIHLPVLLLLIPAIATGAAALGSMRFGGVSNGLIALIVVVQAALGAPYLLAPSNADQEETLIRTALEALPESGGGCLVTMRFGDPPSAGDTQRHFPDYLAIGHEVIGLKDFSENPGQCQQGAVVLLGTRCFMAFRSPDEADVPKDGELEICKAFRAAHQLEAILEYDIPNRRELTFPMYPDRETLTVGVYRLQGSASD